VAQLYPQALGSISVTFYDSLVYGGGNSNPPPHAGRQVCYDLMQIRGRPNTKHRPQQFLHILHLYSLPRIHELVESTLYITIDGQLASLSWNKAPIWGLRPDFYYCQTIAGFLCEALSLTRR
jgi:hypothetical protein